MTNDSNINATMKQQNIEVENENILRAIGMQITPHGIEYFINPLQKRCLVTTLDNIKEKDLLLSSWIIKPNQNSLFFKTDKIHPMVYKENTCQFVMKEEEMTYTIYKVGDAIAEIVQVFD